MNGHLPSFPYPFSFHHGFKSDSWHKLNVTQLERNKFKEKETNIQFKRIGEDLVDFHRLNFYPKINSLAPHSDLSIFLFTYV